ncbi:MAG: phosphoglycerate dehydrogenase [Cyclobacteriaceae bacterium]|nr:phosphoglycerate dehydrogenase [Cyclobacteriaceae bacterium]
MHESLLPMLKNIGIEAFYKPDINRGEIIETLSDFEGLIIRSKTFVNEELLEHASNLKFVGRAGSGIDNLDVDYLEKRGIEIINAPEGNQDAVGEHTIGLILSLLHNLFQGHSQVLGNIWDREGNRGQELGSKTVGIIGYGHMGSTVAKKLQSFGCRVIAYDKYQPDFNTKYAKSVALEELKSETDILSLHVPLTDETFKMTDNGFFESFRKDIIFINTSRGEVASFDSIVDAIKSGKIAKAALDVLENEKLKTLTPGQLDNLNWLKNTGKVIFTPHVAGWTTESYIRINEVLVRKISHIFN